jgi:hypothetical protein
VAFLIHLFMQAALGAHLKVSIQRACAVLWACQSSYRYRHCSGKQVDLNQERGDFPGAGTLWLPAHSCAAAP